MIQGNEMIIPRQLLSSHEKEDHLY